MCRRCTRTLAIKPRPFGRRKRQVTKNIHVPSSRVIYADWNMKQYVARENGFLRKTIISNNHEVSYRNGTVSEKQTCIEDLGQVAFGNKTNNDRSTAGCDKMRRSTGRKRRQFITGYRDQRRKFKRQL